MRDWVFTGLLVATVFVITPAQAQSPSEAAQISAKMTEFKNKNFGCTRTRKAMRAVAADHPDYHFAFAGRKALTITGIRGCGYAWNINRAAAQAKAMQHCRKWERAYGTAGGTRTCHLMR